MMEEKTINGKLGVNKDQLISLLGSTMYRGNVQEVAVKELLQNSFDAVKIAKAMNPTHDSTIWVDVEHSTRTIKVCDNGIGMTPEIVQKAFFTIGGSYKGNVDNRLKSGGLGLAKMAFLFSAETIEVKTVHDGVETYVNTNPEEIKNDDFKIKVVPTDKPNGTFVKVKIPESYIDNNGEKRDIYFSWNVGFLDKPLIGDVKVYVNGTLQDKSQTPKGFIYVGKATAAFGEMDIYISPEGSSNIYTDILISGLYQFQNTTYCDDRDNIKVIVNILPSVGVQDPLYPINNQREGFRSTVQAEKRDLEDFLKKINAAYKRGQYAAMFSSCLSMDVGEINEVKHIPFKGDILKQAVAEIVPTAVDGEGIFTPITIATEMLHEIAKASDEKERESTFDASGIAIPKPGMVDVSRMSLDQPVFHNNTNMVIGDDASEFLKEFGKQLLQLKKLFCTTYAGKSREVSTWTSYNLTERALHQFWGVSFDKGYIGVNVSPKVFDFLAVNPFGFALPEWEGIDQAGYITSCLTHAIIHEYNHNFVSGEGSSFTSSLLRTEAEFDAIGVSFKIWKKHLYQLVKNNLVLISEYHKKYKEANNISTSLDMQ